MIDRYATVASGRLVFDFGDGDVLTLSGLTSTVGLADYLDLL